MNDTKKTHRLAMEQTDFALLAKMRGNEKAAEEHLFRAYELEAQAANTLVGNLDAEPTRSVLFRSAATLAHDCGLQEEAEKLIFKALAGDPPAEIAEELRDLLEQVSFRRHLDLRGIRLSEEEIQMSISGKAVGFGIAPTEVFLSRVRNTETLLYRTAERKLNRPYRDRGRREKELEQNLELFMSVPRAACFAVTFRVGGSAQPSLPGMSPHEEVVDELLDCLRLYTQGDEVELKNRIREDAYYRNFIGLAQTLKPDGDRVNMVGFTAVRRGHTRQVALTRDAADVAPLDMQGKLMAGKDNGQKDADLVILRGELQVANATKKSSKQSGEIEIVTFENLRVKIIVPPGMMSDIVKPLWESEVEVTGTRKGKKVYLMQIRAAP